MNYKKQKNVGQITVESYNDFLCNIKKRIESAQSKSVLLVNKELILLYYDIGCAIKEKQLKEGWGNKTIDRLSSDLQKTFPDMKGFSSRNLLYMKQLSEIYGNKPISQQPVAKLPWGHNVVLIDKLDLLEQRLWYAQQAIENGWSRNVLSIQIETNLYKRQVQSKKITNFPVKLPQPQSDLAEQTLKDPYIFDFLSIGARAHEREIEKELVKHITKFLLELGAGFSFIGQQYHIEVGGEDFYIDLLFYHLKLRCYIVIEIKTGKFKPEYAGQINFYLSAIDTILKHKTDNSTIGLILCKDKNRLIAEYALRDITKPVGVSEYKLVEMIPDNLKTSLPTVEEIEAELSNKDNSK